METVQLKHCPICTKDLPLSEFGICRARKDGRNLYCMGCIRQKVNAQRKAIRAYRALRKQYQEQCIDYRVEAFESKPVSQPSPVEKVRDAIARGFRTQAEIRSETKLGKDEIGDALANLILWTNEVKTQVINGTRMYFENKPVELPTITCPASASLVEIARKTCGPVIKGEKRMKRVA